MAWKNDCAMLVNTLFGGDGCFLFDVFPSFALRRWESEGSASTNYKKRSCREASKSSGS